jgi:alpha-L-rhamnosidase
MRALFIRSGESLVVALSLMAIHTFGATAHSLTVGEGFVDPLGFHDATPAFSWKLPEGVKKQTAYCLEVNSEGKPLWTSGWVTSDQSVFVPYGGPALNSRQKVAWRVNVRDEQNQELGWSTLYSFFELGLLSAKEWKAQWIRPQGATDPKAEQVAWLRRSFELSKDKKIAKARLYVTARGFFSLQLNCASVGQEFFANGWTSYANRLDTLTYDVMGQLQQGGNTLTAMLGTGWYAGRIGWGKRPRGIYGLDPELLLQLEVVYQDGTRETIVSDGQWEGTRNGPILTSSIYDGEHVDARKEVTGWAPVTATNALGSALLTPKPFPPVRVTETLAVKKITEPQPGRFVFDLGQNMVGIPKIKIPVEKDQTVTIRFAEMLQTNGVPYTANYRSAKSTDTYTAAKTGIIEWQPTFTFHGFRYVELSGLPKDAKPEKEWVTGLVLHSDLKRIGSFESSHAKLNQLRSNIVWGQRGNFLEIPTDCPQRDERLGWTGDAQAFGPTAMFNYDCQAFFKSWLGSMRDDQMKDGRIPHVIPDVLRQGDSPGWMDAATFIPWDLYVRTGDTEVLAENFQMMEKLVGCYRAQSVNGLTPKMKGFGDWLQPYAKDNKGETPHHLLGGAFYARSAKILADSAKILGKTEEAKRYAAEAESVKQAFAKHYLDAEGKLQNAPETQTGYVLAIAFDLVPQELKAKVGEHLVRLVKAADGHLRTGFLGTPYLTSVLEQTGHADIALDVLFKETYPSWFYSINQGATTMWERWNSYSHDKGFGDVNMNSFNHYAYGAINQWMVERLAGLAPDPGAPGYKYITIRPLIQGPLDFVKATLETPYGKASSAWTRKGNEAVMDIVIPPNTTAAIVFPDGREAAFVSAGTYQYKVKVGKE